MSPEQTRNTASPPTPSPLSPDDLNRRLAQLLGPRPLTWDDVEQLCPSLNREDARRCRRKKANATEPSRAALYATLFRFHPGLLAELYPRPAGEVILLIPNGQEKTELRFVGYKREDFTLRVFPHRLEGRTTLHYPGSNPERIVAVYAGGRRVRMVEKFDDMGYAVVPTHQVRKVLAGKAALELVVGNVP